MSPRAVRALAPAKLNLALAVTGKRPDGYHDLLTVFQAIDLADRVEVAAREEPGIGLEVTGPEPAPAGPENLVVRAALAFARETGIEAGVAIRLTKRIPVGAGLGGGSSDAAATLLAMEALHAIDLGEDVRRRLALDLGSDVPFFLTGGTALGEGRGERLTPLPPPPPCAWVLIVPPFPIPTADAFQAFDEALEAPGGGPYVSGDSGPVLPGLTGAAQKVRILIDALRQGEWGPFAGNLVNDLEIGVVRIQPRLASIKAEVLAHGPEALGLTGSGSAMFALFRSQGEAAELARRGLGKAEVRVLRCAPVSFGAGVTARNDQGAFLA
jgi:4-diphosphocytidyl-2-C-methyl-D-erythritol kinase